MANELNDVESFLAAVQDADGDIGQTHISIRIGKIPHFLERFDEQRTIAPPSNAVSSNGRVFDEFIVNKPA